MAEATATETVEDRQAWMAVTATADPAALAAALDGVLQRLPPLSVGRLRPPETGMVMVQGRIGGSGAPFNLSEMTVTRCAVQLAGSDGATVTGVAYVAGRRADHAERAALVDALMQDPAHRGPVRAAVIGPLAAARAAAEAEAAAEAAATKVEFTTVARE